MATTTESPQTEDKRVKVDHDTVVAEKQSGMSPAQIAEKHGVAIGTVYKILRDRGEGSGRTRTSSGLNVANDLQSMIDRFQNSADNVKANLDAENERHKLAVASIKAEAEKAQKVLDQIKAVKAAVENGS